MNANASFNKVMLLSEYMQNMPEVGNKNSEISFDISITPISHSSDRYNKKINELQKCVREIEKENQEHITRNADLIKVIASLGLRNSQLEKRLEKLGSKPQNLLIPLKLNYDSVDEAYDFWKREGQSYMEQNIALRPVKGYRNSFCKELGVGRIPDIKTKHGSIMMDHIMDSARNHKAQHSNITPNFTDIKKKEAKKEVKFPEIKRKRDEKNADKHHKKERGWRKY